MKVATISMYSVISTLAWIDPKPRLRISTSAHTSNPIAPKSSAEAAPHALIR